jgi:hypothetical protein
MLMVSLYMCSGAVFEKLPPKIPTATRILAYRSHNEGHRPSTINQGFSPLQGLLGNTYMPVPFGDLVIQLRAVNQSLYDTIHCSE